MKLFLDDIRDPKDCLGYMYRRIGAQNPIYDEEWVVVRNFQEFEDAVLKYYKHITHVSFNHDLADEHYDPAMDDDARYEQVAKGFKEKTGYECALMMKDHYEKQNYKLPKIYVHSMNPVGMLKILQVFDLKY